MSKIYAPVNPNRQGENLLPVQNRLSENDPVYFILDTVTELDISTITAKYEQRQQGILPYSSRMMVALLLYSYFRGILSSRKIMKACQERLTFRAIVGDNIPNWQIIRDFRNLHIKELKGLFIQVLKLCQRAGLVKGGHIEPDKAKVEAKAGRLKEMSYCRIKTEEQRLQDEIHWLLIEAEAVDEQEDQWYAADCRSRELPEQLVHQKNYLELIWLENVALESKEENNIREDKVGSKSNEWHNRDRNRIDILDIPDESEIRPPTWEEAAQKYVEVYQEVISKHKNCPKRQ
jgi:transposase